MVMDVILKPSWPDRLCWSWGYPLLCIVRGNWFLCYILFSSLYSSLYNSVLSGSPSWIWLLCNALVTAGELHLRQYSRTYVKSKILTYHDQNGEMEGDVLCPLHWWSHHILLSFNRQQMFPIHVADSGLELLSCFHKSLLLFDQLLLCHACSIRLNDPLCHFVLV